MGKLNYSARKIDGVKAAQAVAKDLRKRITPGSSARTTSRDPTLELDVSNKNLTDEGFAEVVDALLECMYFRDTEHPDGAARVTELHLAGNQLTVSSLGKLGDIVELSGGDLREVDISRNEIVVATSPHGGGSACNSGGDDAAQVWLSFLRAFEGCYMLKKLDLSGNVLGLMGVEMLARAYMQSDLDFFEGEIVDDIYVDPDVVDDMAGLSVNGNGQRENENGGGGGGCAAAGRSKRSPNKGRSKQNGVAATSSTSKTTSSADIRRYAYTRGLRSVPYIILADISLTTGAAIHLASMIMAHRDPEDLLTFLPPGKAPTLPDIDPRCNGLIWLPNEMRTSNLGHKMLEAAESLRQFTSEMDPEEDQLQREGKLPRDLEGVNLMGLMDQRRQHAKLTTEFIRIAKRARIEALRFEGVFGAEIWGAALRMVTISRTLLMDGSKREVSDEQNEQPEQGGKEQGQDHSEETNGQENKHAGLPTIVEAPALEDEAVWNSEPVASSSVDESPSLSQSHAQPTAIPPLAATHTAVSSKKYVPFYYAIGDEASLAKYPAGYDNTSLELGSARQPLENPLFPSTMAPVPVVNELDWEPQYVDTAKQPTLDGSFQPGAAAFDANFPALGKSSDKDAKLGSFLQPLPTNVSTVSPPQPKKKNRQRKSRPSVSFAESPSTPTDASPATRSGLSEVNGSANGSSHSHHAAPQREQKKRDLKRGWFAELPMNINQMIIAKCAGADGVLSDAQQKMVIEYALDWKSVAAEMKAQGAEEHQQIWKMLDTVECFTYSI